MNADRQTLSFCFDTENSFLNSDVFPVYLAKIKIAFSYQPRVSVMIKRALKPWQFLNDD